MDDERPTPSVLDAMWAYRKMTTVIIAVALVISGAYGFLTRGDTAATAKMVLATPNSDDVVGVSAPTEPTFVRYVQQRALFVTSQQVLSDAADDLDGVSVRELRDRVTATADTDGRAIRVSATGSTAAGAAAISNAVVDAYRNQSKLQMLDAANAALDAIRRSEARIVSQLGQQAAARDATYQNLTEQESTIAIATAKFGSGVTFTDPATVASAVTPGPPLLDVIVGIALGVLIAATVAWLRADKALTAQAAAPAAVLTGPAAPPHRAELPAAVVADPAATAGSTSEPATLPADVAVAEHVDEPIEHTGEANGGSVTAETSDAAVEPVASVEPVDDVEPVASVEPVDDVEPADDADGETIAEPANDADSDTIAEPADDADSETIADRTNGAADSDQRDESEAVTAGAARSTKVQRARTRTRRR